MNWPRLKRNDFRYATTRGSPLPPYRNSQLQWPFATGRITVQLISNGAHPQTRRPVHAL